MKARISEQRKKERKQREIKQRKIRLSQRCFRKRNVEVTIT